MEGLENEKWFGLFGDIQKAREGFIKVDRKLRGRWLGKDINKYRKRKKMFEEAMKSGQMKIILYL